jgi:hypothetical protein
MEQLGGYCSIFSYDSSIFKHLQAGIIPIAHLFQHLLQGAFAAFEVLLQQ